MSRRENFLDEDLLHEVSEAGARAGLVDYIVLKSTLLEPGKFQFALKENKDDGVLTAGVLHGAQGKHNPLQAARNVEMKLDADGQIVAVNLDGDCIVRK